MALSLKVDDPAFEKGEMISVKYLGLFENGGSAREITPEQEEKFVMAYREHVRDRLTSDVFDLSGSRTVDIDKLPEISYIAEVEEPEPHVDRPEETNETDEEDEEGGDK